MAWPRILTKAEDIELSRGTEQRGKALAMFLREYYAGRKSFEAVIPRSVLDRIVSRSGESGYLGKVKPENIAFPYGPDIIRTRDGKWAVIEDNPGFIGGIGDLKIARESLLKQMPKFKDILNAKNDPREYYRKVIELAKKKAHPKTGKIILYLVSLLSGLNPKIQTAFVEWVDSGKFLEDYLKA